MRELPPNRRWPNLPAQVRAELCNKLFGPDATLRAAIDLTLPPLGNEFIALIKNSALVSLLTVTDLMHEGQTIISVSYRSLEVYLAVAADYFILTTLTSTVLRHFEHRLNRGEMQA